MGKLKEATRDRLPNSTFGLPKKRKYPMPDKSHARDAKARASEMFNKGKLSYKQVYKIDSKANRILKK